MNFGNFLGDSAEKVAKEQLQKKAVEVAGEKRSDELHP